MKVHNRQCRQLFSYFSPLRRESTWAMEPSHEAHQGAASTPSTAQSVAPASLARNDSLPIALLVLTLVTGLVDAVSYLGLGHVFTANMTGNVVLLGFAVAGAPGLSVARSLASLIAFLSGAVLGGRLGAKVASRSRRLWLLTSSAFEAALLLAAAFVSIGFSTSSAIPQNRVYALIVLTALAMGSRTATVRRLGVPDLSTVVLTLILAGLAADSSPAGGNNPRVRLRLAAVLSMLTGAGIGALLLRLGLAVPLVAAAGCVIAVTCAYAAPTAATSTGEITGRNGT
jgi:uncharacterized membrane protein YoaK (UPF0700 family)